MKIIKDSGIAEKELFNEVRKLFKLKNTEFVVDNSLPDSYCDKYGLENDENDKIICYLKTPEDSIHEGVHAFFAERTRKLMEKLGDEEFWSREEETLEDDHLEEVTARIIQTNIQLKELRPCKEDVQKKVKSMYEEIVSYQNIDLGKKIMRLYFSTYEFYCICPKDIILYNDIKKYIDPIIIYNKLARYVGIHELYNKI